jgi:hypothetical protein
MVSIDLLFRLQRSQVVHQSTPGAPWVPLLDRVVACLFVDGIQQELKVAHRRRNIDW